MNQMIHLAKIVIPLLLVLLTVPLLFIFINRFFKSRPETATKYATHRSLLYVVIVLAGLISIILLLPVSDSTRTSLLSVFGLIFSAAITLSSTTFIGNAMAGVMLRAMKNLAPGDFIEVEEHFGRISEQGILHMEIQTMDSNLVTLPNIFVVTKPVTIYRSSGTIIAAEVSLGYDLSHNEIEKVLLHSAEKTGLKDPFVQILSLGDFSVVYKCAGFLKDVKKLVSTRSLLKTNMLDCLHKNKIEIVSPNFMNQRVHAPDKTFIPETDCNETTPDKDAGPKDEVIFDKAEEAAQEDALKKQIEELLKKMAEDEKRFEESKNDNEKAGIEGRNAEAKNQLLVLEAELRTIEKNKKSQS